MSWLNATGPIHPNKVELYLLFATIVFERIEISYTIYSNSVFRIVHFWFMWEMLIAGVYFLLGWATF